MAETGIRMSHHGDTQPFEFLNYDALSDDEVEKIKNFLKQPCAAVELPEVTCDAACDQGNGLSELKNVHQVVVPVEYTPAVTAMTVGDHYSAHITQPQMYTVATTVNGTGYIQASYPVASVYLSAKDYLKMVNGTMEGMDASTVAATMSPSAETMMDACIQSPTGGMVVPSNIYPATWTNLYCPQYVIPPHVPTFLTPIAPVHPSGMRAPVPNAPLSVRSAAVETIPSPSLAASPYVTMATLPQAPVATLAATPVAVTLTPAIPAPMNLVSVPPQNGMILPAVIDQEVGVTSSICQHSMDCSDVVPSSEYEVETVAIMNVSPDEQEATSESQQDTTTVTEDKAEFEDIPDSNVSQSFSFISESDNSKEAAPVLPKIDSKAPKSVETAVAATEPAERKTFETSVVAPNGEQKKQQQQNNSRLVSGPSSVSCSGSWGTPKSWASLFKKEAPSVSPSPSSSSAVKLQSSQHVKASSSVDESSPVSSPTMSFVEMQPSVISSVCNQMYHVSGGGAGASAPSNGLSSDVQDDIKILGESLRGLQLDHRCTSFLPRGLYNKGNWCYINATLQALLACPAFFNLLSKLPTIPGMKPCHSATPIVGSMVEFIREFQKATIQRLPSSVLGMRKKDEMPSVQLGQPFEPVYIYDMLSRLKLNAFEGRQEDAEEFLSCLLNGLHDEILAAVSSVESKLNGSVGTTNGDLENSLEDDYSQDDDDSWKVIEKRNRAIVTRTTNFSASPVSNIFCGRIRSALHAASTSSATLQPFFTLQLDIQSEHVWTVREALQRLVIKESLQGYHCSKTKHEVTASRQITLEDLPPILILHLKRFVYNKDGGCQKLSKKVEFSIDLDINKELLSSAVKSKLQGKQRNYKLVAVVYHCGSDTTKGHYVADVYHQAPNAWLRADDARMMPITEAKVLNHPNNLTPYLLFYRRLDTIQYPVLTKK